MYENALFLLVVKEVVTIEILIRAYTGFNQKGCNYSSTRYLKGWWFSFTVLRLPTFNIKNPHPTLPSLLSCIAKVHNSHQKEYYGSFFKNLTKRFLQ